jgi:hypothetical protein
MTEYEKLEADGWKVYNKCWDMESTIKYQIFLRDCYYETKVLDTVDGYILFGKISENYVNHTKRVAELIANAKTPMARIFGGKK